MNHCICNMFTAPCVNKALTFALLQSRNKSKTHWAKLKRKTGPTHKAINHFDDFYGSVFGGKWEPMKKALLRSPKYVAVVNNYGDPDKTVAHLTNRGAHCVKNLIKVQKEFQDTYGLPQSETNESSASDSIEQFSAKAQADDIASIYPQQGQRVPETLEAPEITLGGGHTAGEISDVQNLAVNASLGKSLSEAEIDQSRIIDASIGMSTGALWQYVPTTQLKGMGDWVPESQHYAYYSKGKDFPLKIERETEFTFPEHLKVFTYEMGSQSMKFPEPKRCQTGVMDYYPMDGSSLLPVLALCLAPGERVLELCAAPGGKSLLALQTLLPGVLVCNDISISRSNRLQRIFRDYLFDFETSNKWRERTIMTRVDGRYYTDEQPFDKVLVDVPCTTDRHSVMEDENNIFRPDRVKERLKIPEMQSQLLVNALRLVRVGGAVVYSTCTLSPIQNDGVVHMALKKAFELSGIQATVKDMSACMAPFCSMLELGRGAAAPRYGQLVTPSVAANFGPGYFARIVRTA